jgi:hypothetical protein
MILEHEKLDLVCLRLYDVMGRSLAMVCFEDCENLVSLDRLEANCDIIFLEMLYPIEPLLLRVLLRNNSNNITVSNYDIICVVAISASNATSLSLRFNCFMRWRACKTV